jgi:hypothetical protein
MSRSSRLSCLVLVLAASAAVPAFADTWLAFSQAGIPAGSDIFTWCDAPPCDVANFDHCASPEGGTTLRMRANVWGGWGVFLLSELGDLSAYDDGEMRFFVRTPYDLKVEFQCKPTGPSGAAVTYTTFIALNGWDGTNTWQEITIPIADFFDPGPVDSACLSNIHAPFMTTIADLPFVQTFYVDFARWVTAPPQTPPVPSTVEVQGRQLMVDGDGDGTTEPFVVNGMDYTPIGIGDNWQGAWRDRFDRYSVDFPLIADSGANAVRLYAPILSKAILDEAWTNGLYVIPTYGVDSIQLTCPEGRAFMQDRFVDMVNQWKDHPAILFWLVGNEVNANLGSADLCLDWYPQLEAMALAAHTAEGASFHPVGTASADVYDICVPGCSDDTTLPNVDLWGAQIYRGCTFGGAFNEYRLKGESTDCARPLVVTEFGVDSWDGSLGAQDQTMQADCLELLLDDADQELAVRSASGVSSGQVIFEWADEWWKAECDPGTSWTAHDTCSSFSNFAYLPDSDSDMNEEWWGIVGIETWCSTTTTTACTNDADCPPTETCSLVLDPDERRFNTAHDRVTDSWCLGPVLNLEVVSHVDGTGATDITFDPAAGSTDHTLYYGPLASVSSYAYSGSVAGLGATGSSSLALPTGAQSLFFLVAGRNSAEEGCYAKDYDACAERPCFPDGVSCSLPQAACRTCSTPQCPE